MKELEGLLPHDHLREVVSDLEGLADRSPVLSVAAVLILKNELGDASQFAAPRKILHSQRFVLPGDSVRPGVSWPRRVLGNLLGWLRDDRQRFRDRCDAAFWREVVPVLEERYGAVAEPLMNTVNEAIINYAEYSFRRWSRKRRVSVLVFVTDDDLGYAIVRPEGTRLRVFDPLALKEKSPETLANARRGWGHTIVMRRALFISFDKAPKGRGMMIVVGPPRLG